MEIRFTDTFFSENENVPLKLRLLGFFNRPDVQEKLAALAKHIFPNLVETSKPVDGYSIATAGLTLFGLTIETDGNPHNLCGALIHALAGSKKDSTMDRRTREGLESCVKQMLTIVDTDTSKSTLKDAILGMAKRANLTYDRGAH